MKIAAIDVGSNSIRTVIAQLNGNGTFEIIDQLKDMVRLAEGETPQGGLTPRAVHDGLLALVKAKAICDAHRVDEIIAVATSAVREANNGARFIELARQQTGIHVNVITSEEEARLTFLGAREAFPLGERRALVIDIGGGSVEFMVGDGSRLVFTASVKIGVLRLLNLFPLSDPVSAADVAKIETYLAQQLDPVVAQIHQLGFDVVVGTSGTNLALFNLALQRSSENGAFVGSLNNKVVPTDKLVRVCEWLVQTDIAERRRQNRIQAGRANSIVMGAALWRYLAPALHPPEVVACRFALREGIIVDFLQSQLSRIRDEEYLPDPRRRSVLAFAERCRLDKRHSSQVARLALGIFDPLKPILSLDERAREWLEYAALLHDCGYHVGAKGHHKHSYYLIMNGDLSGFKPDEIRIIAASTRFHRRRLPSKGDEELQGLNRQKRCTVKTLAGILRIAEGLDRTHFGVVNQLQVSMTGDPIELEIFTRGDAELERWAGSRRVDLLQKVLHRRIRVRLSPLSPPFPGPGHDMGEQANAQALVHEGPPVASPAGIPIKSNGNKK